jgi:hypothetical protein
VKRYIDVNKIIKKYEEAAADSYNRKHSPASWSEAYDCIIADLDEEPTADIQEIKHGKWVPHNVIIRSMNAKNYDCSECGEATSRCTPYCPYCGSRMDGEN